MKETEKNVDFEEEQKRITRVVRDNDELRSRHEIRRKKRKRRIMTIRSVALFMLCTVLVFIVLFMTPLFNIRRITVSGNNVISVEEINKLVGYLNGENILKADEKEIIKKLEGIAYIKDVKIKKDLLKTTLNITVVEREACGFLGLSGKYVLVDEEGVILAETNEKPENIPLIIGIGEGEETDLLKMSKENIPGMTEALQMMRELELLADVELLDLSNPVNIRFQYQERLDVECGSSIDMDRKLRLFEAIVNNDNLAHNAQGTVDLSVTGNARYSPERAGSSKSAEQEKKPEKENSQKSTKE